MDNYSKWEESLLQGIYIIELCYIRLAAKAFRLHFPIGTPVEDKTTPVREG